MATVSGTVGNATLNLSFESPLALALAKSWVEASDTTNITGTQSETNPSFVGTGGASTVITGATSNVSGVLAGSQEAYFTGTAASSIILASANTGSTIINNNANGSLVAITDAGANQLVGEGRINAFQTATGGQDLVTFGNTGNLQLASPPAVQANSLVMGGQDTVSIYGPGVTSGDTQSNTINSVGTGGGQINLYNSASLNFFNASSATTTITGSAGSNLNLAGTGNTSVVAGSGTESFNVSTASGNVTLVGGTASNSITNINFVKTQTGAGTAQDVVQNFTSKDSIILTGYGTNPYTVQSTSAGTVLTLSDSTTITFTGISDSSQVTSNIVTKTA